MRVRPRGLVLLSADFLSPLDFAQDTTFVRRAVGAAARTTFTGRILIAGHSTELVFAPVSSTWFHLHPARYQLNIAWPSQTIDITMTLSDPSSASETNTESAKSLRVFLVEDSPAIRDRLAEAMSTVSQVEIVGHAETEATAIAALDAEPCDVVVLDLQLKEGHGFNVLKALRRRGDMKRTVFAIFSNHSTPQYLARGTELGAEYFFDKARGYGELCGMLENLGRRRLQ